MAGSDQILHEEGIYNDLRKSFQDYFGLRILQATTIKRGWLNLKWKVATDSGEYVLKQYNKERYRLYNPSQLSIALSQQIRLFRQGIACPNIVTYQDQILLESAHGEKFIVMQYCKGKLIPPGEVNSSQVHDLGKMTGKMHRLLNDGTLGWRNTPNFIPPSREERLTYWKSVRAQAEAAGKTNILEPIEKQLLATELANVEVFAGIPQGWAHRDLWVDNLLFDDHRLSAILDFDRLNFDYPWLDVARAIMSCAFKETLDVSLAAAFLEGYGEECPLQKGLLVSSLQLLWYMESVWWINEKMDQHSVPPARFAKEMVWLADHLNELPVLLVNM